MQEKTAQEEALQEKTAHARALQERVVRDEALQEKTNGVRLPEKLPKGITRCSDGRYQARYTYEGHRYSLYGHDPKALKQRLEEAKKNPEIRRSEPYRDKLTLDEWYDEWIAEYKVTTVKQGTVDSYTCMYRYYISGSLGGLLLAKIRGEDIQRFYNDMGRKGYSKATITLASVVLTAMFRQAVKNDLIGKNPVESANLPRGKNRQERTVLTEIQQELLSEQIKGSPIEGIVLLALGTGMRIGEITGLEWNDVDFTHELLHVRGTLKQNRSDSSFYRDLPKTGSSVRTIPLLPATSSVLKRERKRQKEMIRQAGSRWNPASGLSKLVFLRENGEPVSGQYVRQQLNKVVNEINGKQTSSAIRKSSRKEARQLLPHFTPHTLRHTFATRAIENGIPPKVVQELLGHSSITMTLDLYTHVLPERKAEEMKKLENLFLMFTN